MNRSTLVIGLGLLSLIGYGVYQRATDPRNKRESYNLTRLEPFTIDARVLSARHYRWGRESVLSPVDLALGWGPMTNSVVLARLQVRQSGRWYEYRWPGGEPPIPLGEIIA